MTARRTIESGLWRSSLREKPAVGRRELTAVSVKISNMFIRPACDYGKTARLLQMGVCGKLEGRIPGSDAREEVQAFHGNAKFTLERVF